MTRDEDFERIKQGLSVNEVGRSKRALDALRALEAEIGSHKWLSEAIDRCHALVYNPTPIKPHKSRR
jgi:hypothetical protein